MADSIDFDFSDISRLAADLGAVPARAGTFVRQAVEFTARNVKDEWNRQLYDVGHAKLTGHSVTYDVDAVAGAGGSAVTADIGPVKGSGRQAGLVLLLEVGSVNNPPHGAGAGALQKNQPDFMRGLGEALRDAERTAGL